MRAAESNLKKDVRIPSKGGTVHLHSTILISPIELSSLAAIGMLPNGARSQAGTVKRNAARLARVAELVKRNPNDKIKTHLNVNLMT